MSHKNSLLFIGGVDKGHTPTNGETMKNQLYLDRFEEFFDIIHVIDTHNWKHRPWVFLQIPLYVLSFPHAKIFLSIKSADFYFYLPQRGCNRSFFPFQNGSLHLLTADPDGRRFSENNLLHR